jgi:hypothetical protein
VESSDACGIDWDSKSDVLPVTSLEDSVSSDTFAGFSAGGMGLESALVDLLLSVISEFSPQMISFVSPRAGITEVPVESALEYMDSHCGGVHLHSASRPFRASLKVIDGRRVFDTGEPAALSFPDVDSASREALNLDRFAIAHR